jgi:1-acyl-sn-glycerol-3-phosphate acyltransferase
MPKKPKPNSAGVQTAAARAEGGARGANGPRTQPDKAPQTSPTTHKPKKRHSKPKTAPTKLEELENKLDELIASVPASHAELPPPSTRAPSEPPREPDSVFDNARELLSTDYYLRRWGQAAMRNRSEEVDDFGYDPTYDARVRPLFDFLYTRYFRVEQRGVSNVPNEGRCMLVANHSGTIPLDGPMLKIALSREHPTKRVVRWLAEDFVFHFPFLGSFESRIGAVRACQENAERLLRHETLLAVFPEGVKGIGKLFKERYQLQRFGRGGFVRLAMRTQTPIVPVAIVGAEETNPMLARLETLAKPLGIPYVPVTPTFPLFGPLGLLPAPTKWKIIFGEPIVLKDDGDSDADELLVARTSERVRTAIQQMLDGAVRERKSVIFG